jgi:hypothetical protein
MNWIGCLQKLGMKLFDFHHIYVNIAPHNSFVLKYERRLLTKVAHLKLWTWKIFRKIVTN